MKIRFHNGAIQTTEGKFGVLFIAAGLAVEVFDQPVARPNIPTHWLVGIDSRTGQKYIQANHNIPAHGDGSGTVRFVGKNAGKQIFYHCGKAEAVPDSIVAEFERPIPQPATE
jgi:hypothetical protein